MNNSSRLMRWLILAALLSPFALSQQRYDSGPWKGFLMARPEGLPLSFAPLHRGPDLKGKVQLDGGAPLAGVIVELRGPGDKPDIRAAKTDAKGQFSFSALPEGTYRLKTMRNGFGPATGEVDISHSDKNEPVVLKVRYAM